LRIHSASALSLTTCQSIKGWKRGAKTPFVEWTDKNETNAKICDEQYKKLFEIVNSLYEAMREGKGKDVMGKILNGLVD